MATTELRYLTQADFETALDANRLQVRVGPARYWTARRNGSTRRWKRNPERFATPCKAGFRDCFTVTEANLNDFGWLRIMPED